MLIRDAAATAAVLDTQRLVDALRRAAVELADGAIVCPPRLVVDLGGGALMLSMPAVAADVSIHKLITVVPANRGRGLATIQGQVTVLDTASGATLALLDGPVVTGRRTAALSMLALQRLAIGPVRDVLLIGSGVQAAHHVDALARLLPQVRVRVRARSRAAAEAFCARHRHALDIVPADVDASCDVVITCTTSRTPVYDAARSGVDDGAVDDGTVGHGAARRDPLVIAVGSFEPQSAEIAAATVRASTVHVDDPVGARREAGDLIQAGVAWDAVRPLATTFADGWVRPAGPLLFKSVGCAAWDLAAARVALAAD